MRIKLYNLKYSKNNILKPSPPPPPPPHFFASTLDSSLSEFSIFACCITGRAVFSWAWKHQSYDDVIAMLLQIPESFRILKRRHCLNFTEVSNLSVKGRRIKFGKLFQDDGVGKIKCLALQHWLACGLETLAIYNFVNHGQRLWLLL